MAITKEERLAHYAAKQAELAKGDSKPFEKLEYFKPQPGLNKIRIIPPPSNRMDFWAEVYKSWGVGPSYRGPIIRGDQYGKPDPVADLIEKLKSQGDAASLARAEKLKAEKSSLCFIVDRGNMEKGIQGFNLNWTVMNEILALFADSDYGDITDPDEGFDLKITYTPGEKKPGGGWFKKPGYQVTPSRHQSPLDFPEAHGEGIDLFEKYEIEEPTDIDFTKAVIDGTEKEFQEARKAAREAQAQTAQLDEVMPVPPPPAPPEAAKKTKKAAPAAPSGSINEAVQKELDEIRAKQAAPPPPEPGTSVEAINADYWIVEGGESVKKPGYHVQALVNEGQLEISCMLDDGKNKWSTPAALGFVAIKKSQVGKDLSEALK